MAMKIRLARGGSKKRPHYSIVASDSRMPRDGRFIEKLGTYNPLLAKDNDERVQMNVERVQHWLSLGAEPTDRVARFLEAAGLRDKPVRANLKKGEPGKAAKARVDERVAKETAAVKAVADAAEAAVKAAADAAEAAAAAAAAPAPEAAPAEDAAPADETEGAVVK